MEIQSILIFALIGALAMTVIAGGMASMMDEEPGVGVLGAGAVTGGLLGSAVSYFTGDGAGSVESVMPKALMTAIGGGTPDMKIGMPNF